jgi:hypothetical protein
VIIEYIQCKWEDLDLQVVTRLTRSTYKYEGRGEYSDEQIERYLKTTVERFPFESVFTATQDGALLGWAGVERQTENIGEIGRWHPYVANIPDRNEIAKSLIAEVIKYAKENKMNRLVISFGDISDESMTAYNERSSWFHALNWSLVEDTFFMNKDAFEEIPEANVPEGFKLVPLLENDEDALYDCHYAEFTTSEAREFYGLSEDEKNSSSINSMIDHKQSMKMHH